MIKRRELDDDDTPQTPARSDIAPRPKTGPVRRSSGVQSAVQVPSPPKVPVVEVVALDPSDLLDEDLLEDEGEEQSEADADDRTLVEPPGDAGGELGDWDVDDMPTRETNVDLEEFRRIAAADADDTTRVLAFPPEAPTDPTGEQPPLSLTRAAALAEAPTEDPLNPRYVPPSSRPMRAATASVPPPLPLSRPTPPSTPPMPAAAPPAMISPVASSVTPLRPQISTLPPAFPPAPQRPATPVSGVTRFPGPEFVNTPSPVITVAPAIHTPDSVRRAFVSSLAPRRSEWIPFVLAAAIAFVIALAIGLFLIVRLTATP